MGSTRKYSLTKKDLIDNGYFVEGEKLFRNHYSKKRGHKIKEIKSHMITTRSKYGVDTRYITVPLHIKRLNNGHTHLTATLHNVIYAWYKGEVPLGYDVDHIDNNTLNNNIDNLQLLTHEENLKKRKIKGINHWYYIKGHDRESWAKRQQELNNKRNNRKLRKELKPQYELYIKILKDDIKKAKDARDFKTWHELISKRIKFNEFVNKYKETMKDGKEEKE